MSERWLPVVGYEGLYEVSDQGRVRSLAEPLRSDGRFRRRGALLAASLDRNSKYLYVTLNKQGKRWCTTVHRLVLDAFHGEKPRGLECRHLDGDEGNNREGNLAWGTRRENAEDRRRHGTLMIAESHACSILNYEKAREIRRRRKAGALQDALALAFNVSQSTISRVVTGALWNEP